MAETALKEEELVIPAGGIADFYLNDDEFEAMNRADANREFGGSGIANFEDVATRMASYGRYGDDKLVHAESGELIVPKALIQGNPELRDSIFGHLRDMGIEDPERYVVGSRENSINPETGLPEFFFKKIFKGVKKAVKSVTKVFKKVAPVLLPIIGTMAFGPIYGAALGSGISTLINGGNIKDAFKSALISGGTGALFSGVTGAISGDGFMSGVQNAANPANLSEGFSSLGKAIGGDFSGISFSNMKSGPAGVGGTSELSNLALEQTDLTNLNSAAAEKAAATSLNQPPIETYKPSSFTDTVKDMFTNTGPGDKGFLEAGKELFMPAGPTPEQLQLAKQQAYNSTFEATKALPGATSAQASAAGQAAMKDVTASSIGPGLLRKFGPAAAASSALAAGAGFFTAPEQEELDLSRYTGRTGEDLIAENPEKYLVDDLDTRYSTGPVEIASPYTIVPGQGTFRNPFMRPQYVADGGEIFPRRVGGIMPDEGIPGQDSVRAMLMPGEFVMTTDAVRGLGNGSEQQGINNMYEMMRGLESRGKAMA